MNAADVILSHPWAMLPENVAEIVSIADRTNGDPEAVAARLGRKLENTRRVEVRDGVATIPVRGPICRYANMFSDISGATSVDVLATDFRKALDDPSVRAIVLDIDSPGGQAAGIGELAAMFRKGCDSKPVHAYVGHMGASAAYWIAAACESVTVDPAALLGSIGVVWPMARPSKGESAKREIKFISSQSPNKRANPETEEGHAQWQAIVDQMAQVFIDAVADYRGTTPEKVCSDFGAGGLVVGKAAVAAGMADRLGSLESLISECSRGGRDRAFRPPHPLASGPAVAAHHDNPKGPKMKFPFATVWAALLGSKPGAHVELPEPGAAEGEAEAPAVRSAPAPDLDAIRAEISAEFERKAEARARADRAERFKAQADAVVAGMVKAGHMLPAEAGPFVARYVDAAELDHSAPLAFVPAEGVARPIARLDHVKAAVADRPADRTLTAELVPADAAAVQAQMDAKGWKVFDNAATDPDMDPRARAESDARKAKMLRGSETGRAVAADEADAQ